VRPGLAFIHSPFPPGWTETFPTEYVICAVFVEGAVSCANKKDGSPTAAVSTAMALILISLKTPLLRTITRAMGKSFAEVEIICKK
jgi:hypothetical protein